MTTDETARAVALEEAVRRFGEAWACGDVAALEPLLSPTYTHTDVAGRFQDRAAWLDYAQGRAGRTTRIDFRDVRTRILGDVAVITGINDISNDGDSRPGARQEFTIRFTQVWAWRDGRWLREALQATTVQAS